MAGSSESFGQAASWPLVAGLEARPACLLITEGVKLPPSSERQVLQPLVFLQVNLHSLTLQKRKTNVRFQGSAVVGFV